MIVWVKIWPPWFRRNWKAWEVVFVSEPCGGGKCHWWHYCSDSKTECTPEIVSHHKWIRWVTCFGLRTALLISLWLMCSVILFAESCTTCLAQGKGRHTYTLQWRETWLQFTLKPGSGPVLSRWGWEQETSWKQTGMAHLSMITHFSMRLRCRIIITIYGNDSVLKRDEDSQEKHGIKAGLWGKLTAGRNWWQRKPEPSKSQWITVKARHYRKTGKCILLDITASWQEAGCEGEYQYEMIRFTSCTLRSAATSEYWPTCLLTIKTDSKVSQEWRQWNHLRSSVSTVTINYWHQHTEVSVWGLRHRTEGCNVVSQFWDTLQTLHHSYSLSHSRKYTHTMQPLSAGQQGSASPTLDTRRKRKRSHIISVRLFQNKSKDFDLVVGEMPRELVYFGGDDPERDGGRGSDGQFD